MNLRKQISLAAIVFATVLGSEGGKKDMPKLRWVDDDKSRNAVSNVVMKILREDKSLSYRAPSKNASSELPGLADSSGGFTPTTDNILVHGDNLEALKALLPFYAGRVKCIYIDPPYNTGSAFEHYDDNLEHSTWLNLMYSRLSLLWEFLSSDGSIWISIDDREGAYLRVICDEIFGRQNFINTIHWQRAYSPKGDSKTIATAGEHVIVYRKSEAWHPNKMPRTADMDKKYKNPDNDVASWTSSDAFGPSASTHQGMVYAIQHPFTGALIYPYANACWRYEQNEMFNIMSGWAEYELRELDDADKRASICGVKTEEVRKGVKAIVLSRSIEESKKSAEAVMKRGQWPKLYFTSSGKGGIRRKTYITNVEGPAPTNWWQYEEVGHTDEAKKEVLKVFEGKSPFATPKPERLIQRILTIATNPGDLVLDSFLGSGTTSAVAMKMGRRSIGIEMGEHAKTHCVVRLKKVVDGEQGGISKAVKWQGGGGFKFYELGEPLLDENGAISEGIDFDTLAAHIWWRETGKSWDAATRKGTFLGVHDGVAYAMLYNGVLHDRSYAGGNVLTPKTMRIIREDIAASAGTRDACPYQKLVVYGECTKLSAAKLKEEKVEFRQTPYDIVTRR